MNYFILQFNVILIILGLGIKYSRGLWPPSKKVDLKDKQTFVISSDEEYDENENEMIHQEDLAGIESLVEDEAKFEPLHSHVENFNSKIVNEKKYPRSINHIIMKSDSKEEPQPFIAGFKHKLDKYEFEKQGESVNFLENKFSEDKTQKNSFKKLFSVTTVNERPGYVKNNHKRIKRSDEENSLEFSDSSTEFFEGPSNGNSTTEEETDTFQSPFTELSNTEITVKIERTNPKNIEFPEKETTSSLEKTSSGTDNPKDYDYDKLKAEYDQQIEKMNEKNEIFNYTDKGEPEESAKDTVNKIVDFKMPRNCTKEELSQIGMKAFECLMYDYKHAKNKTDVEKVMNRTWMVIKIWIFIYILIAIPCWCQKGWCCCCFCCEFCFPNEIIEAEKKYFAENPPGILVKRIKEDGKVKTETEKYKPTLFEYDAYEQLESEMRNI